MNRLKTKVAVTLLAAGASSAFAEGRERPFFQASRALAMGDAYTAYDVGYEAVYYNPAGVARRNRFQVKYLDLEGTASAGLLNSVQKTFSSVLNIPKFVQNLAGSPGEVQSVGLSFLPQLLIRNFSFGLLARANYDAYIDPDTNDLDLYSFTDLGAYVHVGFSLFGGIVKVGGGMKVLDRAEISKTYAEGTYSGITWSNEFKEGLGWGFDAGVLLTLPTRIQPTLGVSIQDIGNTTFSEGKVIWTSSPASGAPTTIRQRVNAGVGFNAKLDRGIKVGMAFDLKDILASDSDYVSRAHAGIELSFNDILYLRAGVNQGRYWTGGIGLHAGQNGLELATYGERVEFGSTGSQRTDRKWMGRYVLGF